MNKNKKMFTKHVMGSAVIVAMFATPVMAMPTVTSSLELNLDAMDTQTSNMVYDESGHVEIGVSSRHESGEYFVQAVGAIRLLSQADATGDQIEVRDVYLQLGDKFWDAQIGRFEATNLFPLAKDTVVSHAGGVSVYEANMVRGRVGTDGGQIAFHLNPSDNFKLELATIFGDDDTAGDDTTAVAGVRPVVTWVGDGVSVSLGYERVNYDLTGGGEVDKDGYGITTSFEVAGASVNLAAARLNVDSMDQNVNSYAANMVYGGFGAGLVYSEEEKAGADSDVTTAYLAYTVPLFDIDAASVTFAGSFSRAEGAAVTDDETNALRVRFNYDF